MIRSLAALVVALAAAPLQDKPDKPVPPSEEFVEMKWDLHADDRFEYKWVYDELHKIQSVQSDAGETSDHREASGEIWFKEGENGAPGIVILTLKKASWTQGSHDHDITVNIAEGKKPDVQAKIKGDPKAPQTAKDALKTQATMISENMKKGCEGEVTIIWNARTNQSVVLKNNVPVKPGPALFDKLYLHSALPNAQVRQGQTWKDPIETQFIPTGLLDIKEVDFKVDKVTATTMYCKAGFQIPIVKPAGGANEQKISGNYQIARDFLWSRSGFLLSSKEEISFNKKVDATGKDAAFYKQDVTVSYKQAFSAKRKSGGKPDEKKDEPKK